MTEHDEKGYSKVSKKANALLTQVESGKLPGSAYKDRQDEIFYLHAGNNTHPVFWVYPDHVEFSTSYHKYHPFYRCPEEIEKRVRAQIQRLTKK